MKSLYAGLLTVVLLASQAAWAQTPSAGPHFYALEHGVVEYEISGAVKGKEILYFDGWGMRQARYKTAETPRWGTTSTITLNLGAQITVVDPAKNLGQKMEDQNLKKLLESRKADDPQVVSLELFTQLGGKKIKTENFLDRPCDVWETTSPKMKVWMWNGISLKTEIDTPEGPVVYRAIQIDEASVIEEKVFVVPETVHFIKGDLNQILISKGRENGIKIAG